MELSIFVRLQGRPGEGPAIAAAIRAVVAATRTEPGCRFIEGYRATRGADLYHIHSRWADEAAFETHAGLVHTVRFLETVGPLVDPPVEVSRAWPLA